MKTFTKVLAITLFFLSAPGTYAQKQSFDSLIQKIDNTDAYIVLVHTLSPRIKGDAAQRIVAIGKRATPDLVRILESENQGIIAHFILSAIWKSNQNEEICCNIRYADGIEIVTINGLEIQIADNRLFATTEALRRNKQLWKKFT